MVMVKPSIYNTLIIWTLAFIMGSVVHMSLYQNVHKMFKYYFKFLEQTDFIPFN